MTDALLALLIRVLAAGVLGWLAYTVARLAAAEDGVGPRHVLSTLALAAVLALVAADRLGTNRVALDDDPLRPTYEITEDPERPPPTRQERQRHGLIVFTVIAVPAFVGLAVGARDHARRRTR